MRLDRRLLGWGLFFVLIGAIPLAVRQGAISMDLVERWPTLWPLVLIASGLGLVLRRTPLHWAGGAVMALTFGLMGGGILATGFRIPAISCGGATASTAFATASGSLGGNASVGIEMACGDLRVAAVDGSGWRVSGTDRNGRAPSIESRSDRLRIGTNDDGVGLFGLDERANWAVDLPRATTIDLSVTHNAGSSTVDLAGANLDDVGVTLNAGSMDLRLGDVATLGSLHATLNAGSLGLTLPARSFSGGLTLNAGSLDLCTPAGAGLRIHSSGALGSNDFGSHGLVRDGDTWTTPGFDAATVRIELSTTANAGSISLNPGDGCHG